MTGSNFSVFDEYPQENIINLPFGIAEIASDGASVITMHDTGKGIVNEDNVKCQFLYELQGSLYLNPDVKNIWIGSVGKNRVQV